MCYAAFMYYRILVTNLTTAHEHPLTLYFPMDKWGKKIDTLAAEIKVNFDLYILAAMRYLFTIVIKQ